MLPIKIISVANQPLTSNFIRYLVSTDFNKMLVGFKILREAIF